MGPPKEIEHWSLTTLRKELIKVGANVLHHGRYFTFLLVEVIPKRLFAEILRGINQLRPTPLPP
jgi:hypothetical protein